MNRIIIEESPRNDSGQTISGSRRIIKVISPAHMAQSDRKRRAILDVHDPRFKAPAQCLRRDYCRPAAAVREHSRPLSKSNTKSEMARKLGEYFQAGVRLVWLVNPKTQTVHVYTAVDQLVPLKGDQALDGGDVLPGFSLPLFELFARNEP